MPTLRGENDNEDRRDQDRFQAWQNVLVAVWIVLLLIGAAWLVDAFIKNNREQECLARGGRTCVQLDVQVPPR